MGEKKLDLIEIDEAVQVLWDAWQTKEPPFKKGTIYNWIWKKTLKNHGPKHKAQIDKEELLKKKGPKRRT